MKPEGSEKIKMKKMIIYITLAVLINLGQSVIIADGGHGSTGGTVTAQVDKSVVKSGHGSNG